MDPTKWGFGEGVCRNQGQTINPNLMDAVDRLEVTGGDCVRTGTVKRHEAHVQTMKNTVHSMGSTSSTAVRPVGRCQGKRGAALPSLIRLNYREPFQAWEMWPSPHTEKPVGVRSGTQDPHPWTGSPVGNQACIVPRPL